MEIKVTLSAEEQAKVDAFCETCDHRNDPQRHCNHVSFPDMPNVQGPDPIFKLTDQRRYALYCRDCAMACMNGVGGRMGPNGFEPRR